MSRIVILAVFSGAIALSACQQLTDLKTVGDAQDAVNKTATAASTIADPNASTLSKVEAGACAGQASANTITDMLTKGGHTAAAAISGDVAKALGYGCTWTLPAKL